MPCVGPYRRGSLCWERRQRVQMATFLVAPLTVWVTLWMLGMKRVRVRRLEWLTLLPHIPILPQALHFMV